MPHLLNDMSKRRSRVSKGRAFSRKCVPFPGALFPMTEEVRLSTSDTCLESRSSTVDYRVKKYLEVKGCVCASSGSEPKLVRERTVLTSFLDFFLPRDTQNSRMKETRLSQRVESTPSLCRSTYSTDTSRTNSSQTYEQMQTYQIHNCANIIRKDDSLYKKDIDLDINQELYDDCWGQFVDVSPPSTSELRRSKSRSISSRRRGKR